MQTMITIPDVGTRFGHWTTLSEPVLRDAPWRRRWVLCLCDCGTKREVKLTSLGTGRSSSCSLKCWVKVEKLKKTYGSWTVIGDVEKGSGVHKVLCRCSCGFERKVNIHRLKIGKSKSCGCSCIKHRLRHHPLYARVRTAIRRCHNPSDKRYKDYGARGIKVYEPWRKDISLFIEYLETLPGWDNASYSMDRIDNDGNYEPGNLRFSSASEQGRNKRNQGIIPYKGVKLGKLDAEGNKQFYATLHLGTFATEEEASKSYERALRLVRG